MNVYMIYNTEEKGYLFTRGLWFWRPQDEALVLTDLDEVEDIIQFCFDSRGWELEIHTFKLMRIL